ncbi:MAG: lysine biosynthesis protein LysX [Thermoprotei archaeon]
MNLGIAYDFLRWEENDIINEAKNRQIRITPIYLKDFSININDGLNLDIDAVIQRGVSHSRAYTSTILFESKSLFVINPSHVLEICENKLYVTSVLAKNNIPVPRTGIAYNRDEAIKLAQKIGYPVVIKPIDGSWGRMVAKADDEDTLRSLLEYQEYSNTSFKSIFYIQEYVRKPNRDIRIFVIGDEVPVGIYRINEKNWRTNTALGARAEPLKIDDKLIDLSLKVKESIGGLFLGIDIFEDPLRGYLVDEVNGIPEYKNTVRVTGFNVSGKLLEKIAEVVKR